MIMRRLIGFVAGMLIVSGSALAHHSQAMFDFTKMVTIKGVVTEFDWSNPHVEIHVDTVDNGMKQSWEIQANSAISMTRSGWTRKQFKPGDQVTVSFHPMKNGTRYGYFRKIVGPDGKELAEPGLK